MGVGRREAQEEGEIYTSVVMAALSGVQQRPTHYKSTFLQLIHKN